MSNATQPAVLASQEPMQVARYLLNTRFSTPNSRNGLWFWRGNFYEWYGERWQQRDREWVESAIWMSLENTTFSQPTNTGTRQVRYAPNIPKVQGVMRALQAVQTLPHEKAPVWLTAPQTKTTRTLVSFSDTILDAKTGDRFSRDETFFDPSVLPCNFEPGAKCPTWHKCLEEWSGGDAEWSRLLQRMFGYCLLPHRDYAKWFLMYGKIRGGKGTIMTILKALLGEGYMGTCLEDIAGQFGLWGIEQARVMAINEVSEISNREGEAACRVLKSIVGKDPISINRKFEQPLRNVVVDAVPIMQSNEIPRLPNKGLGLSGKMVLLPFTVSFAGRENYRLAEQLLNELPGIAYWAWQGARAVEEESDPKQKFPMPERSLALIDEYHTVNNPIDEFLGACFEAKEGSFVASEALYSKWEDWSRGLRVPPLSKNQLIYRVVEGSTWDIARARIGTKRTRGLRGLALRPQTDH